MKPIRATVRIKGKVQGVCFRHYTQQEAQRHGVTGWVRNLPNGDVEAVFEGRQTAVRQVIDWCRQGPRHAEVEELNIKWEDPSNEFTTFDVRR